LLALQESYSVAKKFTWAIVNGVVFLFYRNQQCQTWRNASAACHVLPQRCKQPVYGAACTGEVEEKESTL